MLTCTSPYLKSKNVQMKKKARFYLGFRICTNVQVKLLFLGFHLYIPSSLVHVCKCRKPHKHWVFRSLVHFLISSRGVPPLSIRALERRLRAALVQDADARPRRRLYRDPALAEGEKAAWPVRPRTGIPGVQPPRPWVTQEAGLARPERPGVSSKQKPPRGCAVAFVCCPLA